MLRVRDVMVQEVVTLPVDADAARALEVCAENNIRHVPVLDDGGQLRGIVSDRDLKGTSPAAGSADPAARETALKDILVGDIMVRNPETVSPEDSVESAARAMAEKKIGCLPVISGDGLAGILTTTDLLYLLADLTGTDDHR